MKRLALAIALFVGFTVVVAGLRLAVRSRANRPLRALSTCAAGHVWLSHNTCLGRWCESTSDRVFLAWSGDAVTIGTETLERPASLALKQTVLRELATLEEEPTVRFMSEYVVDARCEGASVVASVQGAPVDLSSSLKHSNVWHWPALVDSHFNGVAGRTSRLLTRVKGELP